MRGHRVEGAIRRHELDKHSDELPPLSYLAELSDEDFVRHTREFANRLFHPEEYGGAARPADIEARDVIASILTRLKALELQMKSLTSNIYRASNTSKSNSAEPRGLDVDKRA